MIEFAVGTIGRAQSGVPKRGIDLLRAMDAVRFDAAREVATALAGLSVKRAKSAAVPGAGSTFLSRCQNGDDCNPLFRLASIFVLGRIAGIPTGPTPMHRH